MNNISKATVDQLSIVLDKWLKLAMTDPHGKNLLDNARLSVALQALIEDLQSQLAGEGVIDRPGTMNEWLAENPYYAPANLFDTGAIP